jgi:hypothetical protein
MAATERLWDSSAQWQLERAGTGANFLTHQIGQTPDQAPTDTTGCTMNPWNSCTDVGKCCDRHDQCYWDFGCTSGSWGGGQGAGCNKCNTDVIMCYLGIPHWDPQFPGLPQSPPSGPASCCTPPNTCDKPVCGAENGAPVWCNAVPCSWTWEYGKTTLEHDTCMYNSGYNTTVWKMRDLSPGIEMHGCCPAGTGGAAVVGAANFKVCR